jgi:hypothetical protein
VISLLVALQVATSPVTPVNTEHPYIKAINACAQGYTDYRYGRVKDSLQKTLNKFPKNEQPLVLLLCGAYEQGFKDGRKGIN